MKKSVFIGMDVSKSNFDAAIFLPSTTDKVVHQKFDNNLPGFGKFLKWIEERHPLQECLFCLENTGNYSYGLSCYLAGQEAFVCVESAYRIKHSMGIQRGKSDPADAQMIAQYAYRIADELNAFVPPCSAIAQLKTLMSFRMRLIKQKTRLAVDMHETQQLKGFVDISFIMDSLSKQLKAIREQIRLCDLQIEQLIQKDQLLHRQTQLLQSIPGIGKVITAHMLAYTQGFSKFACWRKFACYVGTAPFPYQSGTSIRGRTRVSSFANKRLKALLNIGAVNTLKNDNEYRRFYDRKIKEGKHHMVVINAIRNKLISRMFAVIHRDSPYVALQGR
jgi:transposase